ncbi:MAG: hypothetical protein IKJ83_02565 [Ruminococcus sp.]|nr:hypothetical protein [Ruminococcus sp.]
MKNTLRLIAMVLCLLLSVTFIVACGKDDKKDDTNGTNAAVETTAAPEAELISEEEAKEMVWTDLNIQETAAENLTVERDGNNYIIAFQWSGYDYQYTIDGVNKDINEILFNGEPLW